MPIIPTKKTKTPFAKRQIPTLLGLGILVVSLVAGVLVFGEGPGVFAPRATPETTPKNVRVTNLTDKSFTISFVTEEATSGFVKYGTQEGALRSQASDDRDQLSGSVGNFPLHHITVRGLTPGTTYYYTLGTGSVSRFDNNGEPFVIATLPTPAGATAINKTIYGTLVTPAGAPAEGSLVYISGNDLGGMSSLVKASGSWAIALANARSQNGADFAQLTDDSVLNFVAQGTDPTLSSIFSLPISEAQPVPKLMLGETPPAQPPAVTTPAVDSDTPANDEIEGSLTDLLNELAEEEEAGAEEESEESAVLDLTTADATESPTVNTQPTIKGSAAPGVVVTIEINSEHTIIQTLVADENGGFSLDLASLDQQLEPGEHTVTFSYTDPATNQPITRTQTFTVADSTNQLAQADTSSTSPFGSGDPFPVETTPTPTATPSPTPVTTPSAIVATDSGTFQAGSVENTIVLVVGGLFFILAGVWSWWLAQEVRLG
jgi:hypothetical protein